MNRSLALGVWGLALLTLNLIGTWEVKAMTKDELLKQGRDRIISLAVERIKAMHPKTNFDPSKFGQVQVWVGKDAVQVSFHQRIWFEPLDAKPMVHALSIDLLKGQFTASEGNDDLTCFVPTAATKKAEAFVLASLEKDRDIAGALKDLGHGVGLRIREQKDAYQIEMVGETWDLSCRVDKRSGKITDQVQGELVPPPKDEPEEKLTELKPTQP